MTSFEESHFEYIPREENMKVDALSKFASSEIENYSGNVYFQVLRTLSMDGKQVAPIGLRTSWMDPIKLYLETGLKPTDPFEAQKLSVRA